MRYFAALRDHRGISTEFLETSATNPQALYLDLCARYDFPLTVEQTRFVVNGSYVEPTHVFAEGDEVVFIPPVAGG